MAYHFSANQFEKAYSAKRLCNWELPKWYPPKPRAHKQPTIIITDNNGHLLCSAERSDKNPWGYFRSTYELPHKITRKFADEYNECLIRKHKWRNFPRKKSVCGKKDEPPKCEDKCETVRRIFSPGEKGIGKCAKGQDKKRFDLEYVPGDFTPYEHQHASRDQLLQQKYERDNNIEPELPLDKLLLGDHLCQSNKPDVTLTRPLILPLTRVSSPTANAAHTSLLELTAPTESQIDPMPQVQTETSLLPQTAALTDSVGPSLEYFKQKFGYQNPDSPAVQDLEQKMPLKSITAKPNERSPSPIIPPYANFELAKRMHHDNLDHQPLPDCVVDMAFRKRQITGEHPGLALDIAPFATGVGIRTHNAGPTHCTKMKVFRPRTCGVMPKAYAGDLSRPISSTQPDKPMTAMDLAIGWDYRPGNPADEPQPPPHIDGSADTAGPAVFNYVKTPRDEPTTDLGRSAGVFNSTLGETGFFEKDIMRRKSDFSGRIIERDTDCPCSTDDCMVRAAPPRAHSVTRDCAMPSNRLSKHYQSTPNIMAEGYRALRQKYLGGSGDRVAASCEALAPEHGCRRSKQNMGAPGFLSRARSRLCHKVAPEPPLCYHAAPPRAICKIPFRVGVPKYNAAGHFISTDSGCSMASHNASRVLVVPRQRDPYAKRNYDIDTLVPPFRCFGGGAGEGGYPEHWRLASVYQHAYKPLEQRRRPLLQTVYK
nr:uncharacterized protein LOC106619368 [Bactrocera oleae]